VQNLFYNDIFLYVLFKRLDGENRLSRCLPNTRTFVPNDRSQCLYCVLPIMRCAIGAHRRWPCGATNPVQIRWKPHVSCPLSWGRWPSLIRRNRSRLHEQLPTALTKLYYGAPGKICFKKLFGQILLSGPLREASPPGSTQRASVSK